MKMLPFYAESDRKFAKISGEGDRMENSPRQVAHGGEE